MINRNEKSGTFSEITQTVGRYLKLLLEDTRLSMAEKLTRLLSAVALCALLTIVGTVALVFVSIAVGFALADAIDPLWSFVIVAGFYIILMAVLVLCRTSLLVNPIARFISRLVLQAPAKQNNDDKPAALS